ncbi:tRNA (adenosine(37)-N6)-dimethylallyltransferase MiaA [Tropheryma whipplei]|uniref:tRNA dimethylallyltransferase n=1 Tax=Tropheryma whipplei (strain Twist) TaxID=203267 RepID=MIAA_TROWT|nr:tRNA (adenosine(37)-N6)-dimethylallyltransferase MiaA [Tropheryma whipplei]Q820X9.1 RecName: Full=tRNA dimethylallyltransferase; AltName: Full=Dimethylallyl diphosphate:tRNA dimethylallyltransferase; Short=DMAPP:tRNA dimethylallyltransferase; Short=DMATase; AltName: Full=Isopentenyl-diphosphate:tRNA isopentenyltransferase; Short=IPP transferase; Short=IPPT; Short=IPTase [Tropheryma whipplei str. Twist]AAO44706.1 tRNA isopentenylpyrophosphate transferase [Tropheryma whipplei str. Twist]MCO8182
MLAVAFVGATGTGKSLLSLDAARDFNGHIVNADSMQLYRDMDIGTAKLSHSARQGIPHHQIDVIDPSSEASVARYKLSAQTCIKHIHALNSIPFLVGGSGLYVSSVVHNLQFPPTDGRVRKLLEDEADKSGIGVLHDRLLKLHPGFTVSRGNRRRIIRALEVAYITGRSPNPVLPLQNRANNFIVINLICDKGTLDIRLQKRVESFYDNGLIDEVRLLQEKYVLGRTAAKAIGYKQAIMYLAGEISCADAKDSTLQETIRLANKQIKWFRRYSGQHIVDTTDMSVAYEQIRSILNKSFRIS